MKVPLLDPSVKTEKSRGEIKSPRREESDSSIKKMARRLSSGFESLFQAEKAQMIGSMVWGRDLLVELMEAKSVAKVEELGGLSAVAKGLGSNLKRGLTGSDEPMRKERYGMNKIKRRAPPSYWDFFAEAMQDSTVVILLAAAAISITLGVIVCAGDLGQTCPRKPIWQGPIDLGPVSESDVKCLDWLDGAAIIAACLLIGVITASNESSKEKQFRVLQDKQQDSAVTVRRNGIEVRIQSVDVMVGDVVLLDLGSKVPADGLLVHGNDLKVDESSLTGEADSVSKTIEHDPFVLSGCTVVEGDCSMLVTAVGEDSVWGKIMVELDDERDETPLQGKLTTLAEDIGRGGTMVAAVCFLAQIAVWFVNNGRKTCFLADTVGGKLVPTPVEDCRLGYPGLDDEKKCLEQGRVWLSHYENFSLVRLQDIVGFFIDSVTIIVVAVPEGLPLAVTIALAYSVKKMQADQNLVRVMAACETMGGVTSICSDKTGTLTENLMTVVDGFLGGQAFDGVMPKADQLAESVKRALVDGIALNFKACIGADAGTGRPEIIGNRTEGALVLLLRGIGADWRACRDAATVHKVYAFNSVRKTMATAIARDGGGVRVLIKGASEVVLGQCSHYMNARGEVERFPEELRKRVLQYITKMASRALRTITMASIDLPSPEKLSPDAPPSEGLTLIGVFGIQDPVRKEVPAAVRRCQKAGITVRMVTGDNVITAKSIAREAGIFTSGKAMEGGEFRALDPQAQRRVLPGVQVLARASPLDKLVLVQRLKEMGEVVAVTGDGTNDAPALKEADVGLSMGIAGTAVAQEASDMVILDDNFSSIVKSVMWGRSVYDNIRKFLQFQLTVNVVALTVCTLGAILGFGTPLKPVQLLWVNLIMDTLGALALATEAPTADLLDREPYGRHEALVNGHMWRNILFQSVYQLAVQVFLLIQGSEFLTDCTWNHKTGNACVPLKPNGQGKNLEGNYRDTVIYNAFVWCQIFNEINARKLYNEKNVFKGLLTNSIFITIILVSCVVQFFSVQYWCEVFKTTPLDVDDWCFCLCIGAFSLFLGLFQRFLPPANWLVDWIDRAQGRDDGAVAPQPSAGRGVHDL